MSFLLGLILFAADWGKSFLPFTIAAAASGVLLYISVRKYRVYILSVTVCVLIGLVFGKIYTLRIYEPIMSYDGKNVVLDGYITDFSYTGSDVCRITVKGRINGGRKTSVTYFAENDDFDYYQYVTVTGRVSAISDTLKFDSQSYNRPRGVFLEGDSTPEVEIKEGCRSRFMRSVMKFRDHVSEFIRDNTGEREGAFLTAMLCGDKTELDDVTKTMLYRSGIGHLFAVSGTHLSVIAMFFGIIINRLFSSKRIRFLLIEAVIVVFIAFAGFSPSVIRAGIMMSAVQCSGIFRRRADTLNSLGICAAAMCAFNPYLVRSASFSMSLAAAFAAGAVGPALNRSLNVRRFAGLPRAFVSVTVVLFVTLPLAAVYFTEVSVISPVTNLFAIPFCTLALTLVTAAVLTGGGAVSVCILKAAGAVAGFVIRLAQKLAGLSFAAVPSCRFAIIMIFSAAAAAGIVYAVVYKKFRVYAVTTLLVYCGIYASVTFASFADRNTVYAAVFPGKRSCAAVVYQNSQAFVIDLNSKGEYASAVQRFASYNGIKRIAGVFIESGVDYSKSVYELSLVPQAEAYYSDSGISGSSAFPAGTSADLLNFTVTEADGGYAVSAYGNVLELFEDKIIINGNEYETAGQDSQILFSFGGK